MMRFTVDARAFSDAMSKVSKVLRKSPLPILEEIAVRVENGLCTLTATDLETWLVAELPAHGDDVSFVFSRTKDVMKACAHFEGELAITFVPKDERDGKIEVLCGQRAAEFPVIAHEDYPECGTIEDGITLSEIDTVNAAEIINLTPKKRTLFGTLLASAFRSIWTVLTVPSQKELKATADVDDNVREAVVEPVQEEKQESVAAQAAPCATEDTAEPEPVDEELNRIVGIFKLAREQGYTLKLIPGTPEENAPVFDFEHERILRNAA